MGEDKKKLKVLFLKLSVSFTAHFYMLTLRQALFPSPVVLLDQGILEGPAKCSGSTEQDEGNSQNMHQGNFTGQEAESICRRGAKQGS